MASTTVMYWRYTTGHYDWTVLTSVTYSRYMLLKLVCRLKLSKNWLKFVRIDLTLLFSVCEISLSMNKSRSFQQR